jgi:Ca-activated chloride channel family protein
LGLASLVVALARPQHTYTERTVESEGVDIVLALDVSQSMEQRDFRVRAGRVDRLAVAKRVVSDFVEGRAQDRIGLVVFGTEAFTQVPLTTDHQAVQGFLDQVNIGMAGPKTAIGQALAIAARQLAVLEAPSKVVVLLTDGENTAGRLTPEQAAEAAAALGVKVYTIGVGAQGRSGLMGLARGGSQLDEETLQNIAEVTGGKYFRATDTRSLVEIYETIDDLETSRAETLEYIHRIELYRLALVPGLAMLVLQLLLGQTLFRRLP